MRSHVRRAVFFCLALSLAACGGGGGGSTHVPGGTGSSNSGGSSPAPGTGSATQATLTISVHPYASSQASKRSAAYVAPTTESATFQVTAVNGQAVTGQPIIEQDLISGSTGCTTSGATVTCATTVPVIVGTVTFQVKTYNQTGAQGTLLGTTLANATIVSNQANRIALTVQGVIASVQLFLSPQALAPGTAATSLLVVVPQDADGNIIVNPGNYDQPIQLSISGGTVGSGTVAHIGFEEDGATTPSATATVASPNDQVYVAYDGTTGVTGAAISASVTEGTNTISGDVSLTIGTIAFSQTLQGTGVQNAGFAFTGANQSGVINISGGTLPYYATFNSSDVPSSKTRSSRAGTRGGIHILQTTSIANVTVSGSEVQLSTPTSNVVYGTATLYVYDSSASPNIETFPISVTAPAISITPSCPTGVTCTTPGVATFPATTTAAVTLAYSGGAGPGTYVNSFASTNTATSSCVSLSGSGASYTATSTGSCSDLLTVTSGGQSAYYEFVQPSATANYAVASTSHAYVPASPANAVAIADGGQASIALSAGNGPWTASISGTSPSACSTDLTISNAITGALNNSGFVLSVTSNPSAITTCGVTFTPTNPGTSGGPVTLTALLYPKMTVSQQSFQFHAPGDAATVSVYNSSPGGLTAASGSVEIASPTINAPITPVTYTPGTPNTNGTVGFSAGTTTGTALVSIHDTNFDEKYGVSVSVDNAYAQSLPTAIGVSDGFVNGSGPTPYVNSNIPSWVVRITLADTTDFSASFSPGSPGTLTLTPSSSLTSSMMFGDAAGGAVTVPITSFLLDFANDGGANIGAQYPEAFPGTGLSDSVTVDGPSLTPGYTVTSSDPTVVQVPSGPQTSYQFTATSVGAGLSTITITDNSTGASTSYRASVTSVTIPILGHGRKKN